MTQSYKLFLLLAIVCSVFTQGSNSGTIDFAPQPTINSTAFYQLDSSPIENQLILSDGLINLVMTQFDQSGTRYTNVTVSSYKRSAPTREITTTVTLTGNWTYIEGQTRDELTCLGLYDSLNFVTSPVRYDANANTLTVTNTFSIVGLAGTNNVTLENLMGQMIVGSDCFLFGLTYNNFYREFTVVNQTVLFQVEVPENNTPKAYSDDLRYGVWVNHLHRWTNLSVYYSPVATLNIFDSYSLKSVFDRTTVVGRTASAPNGAGQIFSNYTIYTYRFNGVVCELVYTQNLTNVKESASARLDYRLSPNGDKLMVLYNNSNGVLNMIAKQIDYNNNVVTDLQFDNSQPFIDTAAVADLPNEWDVSNQFIVIKNVTNAPSSNPIEVVYQMIGTRVLFVRSRSLAGNTNQTSNFVRVAIDPDITSQAYILQVYRTGNTTFELWEVVYGNYFTNNVLVKQSISNYLTFLEPAVSTRTMRSTDQLFWFYEITTATTTNYTLVYNDNATSTNTNVATLFFNSVYNYHYQNYECLITSSPSNAIFLYQLNKTSGNYELKNTLTSVLAGVTINTSTVWGLNTGCTRMRVNNNLYVETNGTFAALNTNVTWTVIDQQIMIVMALNKMVYKLNTTDNNNTFVNVTNSTVFIPADSQIISHSSGSVFAITYQNGTSAQVQVFAHDSNMNVVSMFNYTFANYTNAPTISLSPMLTKLLIFGVANVGGSSSLLVNAYAFNFNALTSMAINFPTAPLTNAASVGITIGDHFMFARQLSTSNSDPAQQFGYFLSGGVYPKLVVVRNVTLGVGLTWLRAILIESGRDYAYIMNTFLDTSVTPQSINVTSYQVWNQQAFFDYGPNYFSVQIFNSLVTVCPFGCRNCQCSTCFQGFALDTSTFSCRPCSAGCAQCSAADTSVCQACLTGRYLNTADSTCLPCSSSCVACSDANTCTVCPPGQFVSNGVCSNCPSNCFNCTDATTCLTCREGFGLISNVTSNGIVCGACTAFCSECNASNITQCIRCQRGTFMNNGVCETCGSGCLACTNALVCDVCIDGFVASSLGTCEPRCQLPCLTCSASNPTQCTSCQSGTTLDSSTNTCVLDLTCNANSSCVTCGRGLNYFLLPTSSGATCEACPVLENCVQCDYLDPNSCSICAKGFYRDTNGLCVACSGNCLECKAPSTCTQCKGGFTLKQGFLEGQCLACNFPCATCIDSPNNCLTCASGTFRLGWTCRNTARYVFSFVIPDNISDVLVNIRPLKNGILQIMNSTNEEDVLFSTFTTGSTVVTGTGQTNGDIFVAADTFRNGLANGIPGTTYQPSNVNVRVEGASQDEDSNVGMIVGIVIGSVVFVIIVIAIICYCVKNRRSHDYEDNAPSSTVGHNPEGDRARKGSHTHLHGNDTGDGYNKGSYPNLA